MKKRAGRWTAACVFSLISSFPATAQSFTSARVMANEGAIVLAGAAKRSGPSLDAFLAMLRHMESRGDYRAVNTLNFIGAYQFGEAALIDLGYVKLDRDPYDNNFGGGFTGKDGIRSVSDFLATPRIQDRAAHAWMTLMWHYIEEENLNRYAWTKLGGVTLTPSGMLGATHLLGTGGLREFIQSGGSARVRDPYGTPILRYVQQLSEFDVPFGPERPEDIASLN